MSKQDHHSLSRKKFTLRSLLKHIFYILASTATLGPLIWIILLSFKTTREYTANPFGLPESFFLGNYIRALIDTPIVTFLINSIIVTSAALALILIVSTLAGYALARIPFNGSIILFVVLIMCNVVPIYVLIIPLFVLINLIGLSDSLWGLIFSYVAMRTGLSVVLMRSFFRSIPSQMEDAAKIDGCNLLQNIWYVMLPIVRPGLVVTVIINYIFLWNEYFLATIILSKQALFTLPPGLAAAFMGRYTANWPVMAAGFTLCFLPTLLVLMFAQDKIVVGWTVSSK